MSQNICSWMENTERAGLRSVRKHRERGGDWLDFKLDCTIETSDSAFLTFSVMLVIHSLWWTFLSCFCFLCFIFCPGVWAFSGKPVFLLLEGDLFILFLNIYVLMLHRYRALSCQEHQLRTREGNLSLKCMSVCKVCLYASQYENEPT